MGVAPLDEVALEAAYSGPPEELAAYLARAKAEAALADSCDSTGHREPPALVLTADTTVLLDDRVLGKPGGPAEAVVMLRALRDRAHTVVTGVALARRAGSARHRRTTMRTLAVATRVQMRDYTDEEIADYVASGDSLDKAGAYGVQHPHFQPVASIEGCYTAVVGLPLCAVAALLGEADHGVVPIAAPSSDAPHPCPFSPHCQPPLPEALQLWRRQSPLQGRRAR
jgi:MAF protein